ncbi:hypothetical protein HNP84_009717 [Thermocatellispora tengchongensis]|uniref:Uncharacterized protein n=1 Tax=Thermocatellispora tengchongensis TaxID=1073253 RepID=A0A840PLJ0_9ACTN|nr:hypothetical protein [Thermocatellispora tengchongensis]MBB5139952.1 hypothetical protein [Thermocatellispora tengchongensis]
MIRREQAELARDHALNARRSLEAHMSQCRTCTKEAIPCELGGILMGGSGKICREAADALAAYLPRGTEVVYRGKRREYWGREFTVAGLAPKTPWSGYTLRGKGVRPFIATLASVHPSSRESQQREQFAAVKHAVEQCCAVLARHGITVDAKADRTDSGSMLVTWSSAEYVAAEARVVKASKTEAGQYLAAALYLLQVLRADTARRDWVAVARAADSARKLADRVRKQVESA